MRSTLEAILMAKAKAKAKGKEKAKEPKEKVGRTKEAQRDGATEMEEKVEVIQAPMQEEHLKQEEAGAYLA